MTTDQITLATFIVACFALIISWLVYRLTRKGGIGRIKSEWSKPNRILISEPHDKSKTLYCLFEGLFTNVGSRTVSLVLLEGDRGRFASTERLVIGEKITRQDYHKKPRIFVLSEAVNFYLTKQSLSKIMKEREVHHDSMRLNIPIEPGHSKTFALSVVFQKYEKEVREGLNTFINFSCGFNNGDTAYFSIILDGTLIPENMGIEKKGDLPREC